MVNTRDYKLAIGIMEWNLYVKRIGDEIEILVVPENGSEIAKAKLLKNGMFIITESQLSWLEKFGIERILEIGRPAINEVSLEMR